MVDRERPSFASWMGSLWGYTLLRFLMFFLLWAILLLFGLEGFLAAVLALALSVPLSLVLLAGPRRKVAQNIEARVNATREARRDLDERLDPGNTDDENPQ